MLVIPGFSLPGFFLHPADCPSLRTGEGRKRGRDVVPNPLQDILECADIRQIYCNGATAWKYYRKYQEKQLGREAVRLPSTSPANAAWSVERLLGEWSQCGEVLRNGE